MHPRPQALLLLLLPILVPLPLKHHLWTQLLALRSVLPHMQRLAALRATHPLHAAACVRFVRWARLATVEAVAPGAAQQPSPSAMDSCWLSHTWTVVMVGLALPTFLQAALAAGQQDRRQQGHRQRQLQRQSHAQETQAQQQQQQHQQQQHQQQQQQQSVSFTQTDSPNHTLPLKGCQPFWPHLLHLTVFLWHVSMVLWAGLEAIACFFPAQ